MNCTATSAVATMTRNRELRFFEALPDFSVLLTGHTHLEPPPFEAACLERWKARWAVRVVASLGAQEIQGYLRELSVRGASEHQLRAERALLGNFYRWVTGCGFSGNDPTRQLDRTRARLRPQGGVHWNATEQRRLLEAARSGPAYLHPLILLAIRTGLRLGHLLNLEWRHIDLVVGRILIPAEEVASGRPIVISLDLDGRGALAQILDRALAGGTRSSRIFDPVGLPLWNGKPDLHSVRSAFRQARRRSGIPEGEIDSLRLTFARNCAKACVPVTYPVMVGDWEDDAEVKKIYEAVQGKSSGGARGSSRHGAV